jgi:hypothetical protein
MFHRHIAAEKPFLKPAQKAAWIVWARVHRNWDFNVWKCVIWTDETSFSTGGFGKVYVTRQVEVKVP